MKRKLVFFIVVMVLVLSSFQGACALAESPLSISVLLLGIHQPEGEERSADAIVAATLQAAGAVKLASIRPESFMDEGNDSITLGYTLAAGGPQATLHTVNNLFSLNIKNYVLVDLGGMAKIIDALGGIDLVIDERDLTLVMSDGKTKAFEKAGQQTLTGAQAVAYMKAPARDEKSYLSTALSACMQKALRLDLDAMMDMVSALMPYVETNMTLMDMMETAMTAVSMSSASLETKQFPLQGTEEKYGKETAVRITNSTAEAQALNAFLYGNSVNP